MPISGGIVLPCRLQQSLSDSWILAETRRKHASGRTSSDN